MKTNDDYFKQNDNNDNVVFDKAIRDWTDGQVTGWCTVPPASNIYS